VDSKAECDQLNLAHVTRKNIKEKKLKQTKCQCPLNSVQVQDPWRQSERNRNHKGIQLIRVVNSREI